jgi:hypothetical protein
MSLRLLTAEYLMRRLIELPPTPHRLKDIITPDDVRATDAIKAAERLGLITLHTDHDEPSTLMLTPYGQQWSPEQLDDADAAPERTERTVVVLHPMTGGEVYVHAEACSCDSRYAMPVGASQKVVARTATQVTKTVFSTALKAGGDLDTLRDRTFVCACVAELEFQTLGGWEKGQQASVQDQDSGRWHTGRILRFGRDQALGSDIARLVILHGTVLTVPLTELAGLEMDVPGLTGRAHRLKALSESPLTPAVYSPDIMPTEPPEQPVRRYAYLVAGELTSGTLADWARAWEHAHYSGEADPGTELRPWDGEPVHVEVEHDHTDEKNYRYYRIRAGEEEVVATIDGHA